MHVQGVLRTAHGVVVAAASVAVLCYKSCCGCLSAVLWDCALVVRVNSW